MFDKANVCHNRIIINHNYYLVCLGVHDDQIISLQWRRRRIMYQLYSETLYNWDFNRRFLSKQYTILLSVILWFRARWIPTELEIPLMLVYCFDKKQSFVKIPKYCSAWKNPTIFNCGIHNNIISVGPIDITVSSFKFTINLLKTAVVTTLITLLAS